MYNSVVIRKLKAPSIGWELKVCPFAPTGKYLPSFWCTIATCRVVSSWPISSIRSGCLSTCTFVSYRDLPHSLRKPSWLLKNQTFNLSSQMKQSVESGYKVLVLHWAARSTQRTSRACWLRCYWFGLRKWEFRWRHCWWSGEQVLVRDRHSMFASFHWLLKEKFWWMSLLS